MPFDKFERLLNSLPEIAEAVNSFESPEVQEQAFQALVRALDLAEPPDVSVTHGVDFAEPTADEEAGDGGDIETETTTTTTRRRRKRSASASVSAERNVDFRPQGKQAFRDFVAEKQPKNQHERNVAAVYYLEQVLDLQAIGAGHVLAAYKDCSWREPASPANSLQVTASTKNWLDTKDMTAIRTTASGRNAVEHDMPIKPNAVKP